MKANKRARGCRACFSAAWPGVSFIRRVKNENDKQIDLRNAFAGSDVDGWHGIGGR
jgi:hypothetical protein